MVCPHCGADQEEASAAVSSFCRACGEHFRLSHGKAVAPRKGMAAAPNVTLPEPVGESGGSESPSDLRANLSSLLFRKQGPRDVVCFECGHEHRVAQFSSSSLCPACGSYISLVDHEINHRSAKTIRTRGDVVVGKKGVLLSSSVICDNLTVLGQVTGKIECSGIAHFRSAGKVLGTVRCHKLIIDRRADLHFCQPIRAEEVEIHATTKAHITCTGRAKITSRATLIGSLTAKTVSMVEGASMEGPIRILSAEPSQVAGSAKDPAGEDADIHLFPGAKTVPV